MEFISPASWWARLFAGERKAEKLKLLQQQRLLLHAGIEATAEVIDASLVGDRIGHMLPVRLWLRLREADGRFIYTHTQSLVKLNQIPAKGALLRIKYLPDNLSSVLVL